ncbi:hypothetical protein [Nocardia sp. BMG111209]|uniref:hypothetical protein n=1 Tax=Nocardia sp. BMG111209 TaxID=1160137 RepID=UPI00038090F1|nr:hypothetical protein [Nocardia sp. BMG111209]
MNDIDTDVHTDAKDETAQPDSDSAEPERRRTTEIRDRRRLPSGRGVRRAAAVLVVVVAIAATTLAAIFGWKLKQHNDIDSASQAALTAARSYAVTLTNVDANNLDGNFKAVLDGATGDFKDMYTRSSGQLRQLLQDNKASGKGTVLDAAVKSATTRKVEVLLFIDQTVTNSASPDARVDRSRVEMTMDLVDGRWLASRVFLP